MSLLRFAFDRRRAIAGVALICALAVPGGSLAQRLRARLPDPLNANRHITVITTAPAPPVGTPLLRVEPGLAVIGVVEGPAAVEPLPVPTDVAVRVSVFPEAEGLVREDSRIDFRTSSTSLLEIVQKHFTPARRARLVARLESWRAAHEQAIEAALARLKEIADRDLGADEMGRRIWRDPALRGAVSDAFEREVIDPVDWSAVVEKALASEAADSTGDLLKHFGPLSSGWAGLRAGYRARWSRTFGDARDAGGDALDGGGRALERLGEGDPDEALLAAGEAASDLLSRSSARRAVIDPESWIIEQTLGLLVPDPDAFQDAAVERAARNIRRALPQHRDRLARDFAKLGKEVAGEVEVERRSLSALKGLAADQALRRLILERHGPEAERRVETFFASVAEDPVLADRSRAVLDSGLQLAAGVLREITLDDEGRGPNPLLVAFVREKMRGDRVQPVLILRTPGSGAPVSEGQLFVSRRT